jgi:isopenicillin N synthase-like dioxygenase
MVHRCLFSWVALFAVFFMATILAEADEQHMIPIIDIQSWTTTDDNSSSQEDVAHAVERACREIGFFAITGHGVNHTVLERAWMAATELFDASEEIKLSFQSDNQTEYPYGYERSEVLERGKQLDGGAREEMTIAPASDLKETFSMGSSNPDSGMPPRRFLTNLPGFQAALEDYYREMEKLSNILLQVFALALKLPTRHWFDDKMDHHMSALRLLNYSPMPQPQAQQSVRAGAHTDYGVLTILKTGGPGLQVQTKDKWINVPHMEDAFVLNLGDLMQRWTNGECV